MLSVRRRTLRRLFASGLVLGLVLLIWFLLQVFPVGGPGPQVIVRVQPGDSIAAIAVRMHDAGVIHSSFAFRLDTLLLGGLTVRPGSYEIDQNAPFSTVRAILGGPPNVQVVSVTPGLTLHEVALEVVAARGAAFANAFVRDAAAAAARSGYRPLGSLEGLIGVGDYVVTPSATPGSLVTRMMQGFATETRAAGFSPTSSVGGLNAYQLLIAASIVEKEGYLSSNMPRVARVIFNRLQRGGPLQMDATILYALGQDGGTVTPSMLKIPSPYNTYLTSGLTPTPICTVSANALRAVLHAPPGPWLYFTLVNQNGTEAFVTTLSAQLANERLAASRGIG